MRSFQEFGRLADVVGGEAALRLCAFAGTPSGRRLYVPVDGNSPHILRRAVGAAGFTKLVAAFGGQTIIIPGVQLESLRTAGRAHALLRQGLSRTAIAHALGVTVQRVHQLESEFKDLTDEGLDHDDHITQRLMLSASEKPTCRGW